MTTFELYSWQSPNCETAAKLLWMLLQSLKREASYPWYPVPFLRGSFLAALKNATQAETLILLRVLETWSECCGSIWCPFFILNGVEEHRASDKSCVKANIIRAGC